MSENVITLTGAEYVALINDATAYRHGSKTCKYTLITRKEVELITRMGRSTIYDAMRNGDFPHPIKKANGKGVVWLQHEIEEWIERRMKNRASADEAMDDDS